MKIYNSKESCCGCAACINICPRDAIKMAPDEYGFVYPVIDDNLCINCGLCKKVCTFSIDNHDMYRPIAAYAAINKNEKVLQNSSSGGVFGALAELILCQNGVVFGCILNENLEAIHEHTDNILEIRKMQGSKYVQSEIRYSFRQVKDCLLEGRKVLFTGTPCQVAGLKSFLNKDYEGLITADIVCHGVPNQMFLNEYIELLERKNKAEVSEFIFRGKYAGWNKSIKIRLVKKNGRAYNKVIPEVKSYYISNFIKRLILRDSCYNCKYASVDRPADLTMCDYWGIKKVHPEIDANSGVSGLLVNTEKGKRILINLLDKMVLIDSDVKELQAENLNLIQNTPVSINRSNLLKKWKDEGCMALEKVHLRMYRKASLRYHITKHISTSTKEKIKKILRM